MKKNKDKTITPVFVNPNACDGCGLCARVCPVQVFEMKDLSFEEINKLSFFGRLKVKIKGNTKSRAIEPKACIRCGKCVNNCHEHAITVMNLKKSA